MLAGVDFYAKKEAEHIAQPPSVPFIVQYDGI